MIDFVFRLFVTIMLVMILQISIAGRTLEGYLIHFIRHSESTQPLRDIAYSNIERLNLNGVQIPKSARSVASISKTTASDEDLVQNSKEELSVGTALSHLMKIAISPSLVHVTKVQKAKKDIEKLQKELDLNKMTKALQVEKALSE